MSGCRQCGAEIALSRERTVVCPYCSTPNDPLPRQVEVPVPVQVVHNVVQVVGDDPAARELRCPHCKKRLVGVSVKDVALHGCGACGGIWIENASAMRVLQHPDAIFGELASRAGRNARRGPPRAPNPTCAECPAVLDPVFSHGVELDVCGDHGTWFDAFELVRLIEVLNGKASSPSKMPDREVLCSGCKRTITQSRANLTGDGLMCDGCWRAAEAKLVADGDKQAYRDGSVAFSGLLLGVAGAMLSSAFTQPRER
jgi:Zn-finger nucleic acid-binding protein